MTFNTRSQPQIPEAILDTPEEIVNFIRELHARGQKWDLHIVAKDGHAVRVYKQFVLLVCDKARDYFVTSEIDPRLLNSRNFPAYGIFAFLSSITKIECYSDHIKVFASEHYRGYPK